MDGWMDGCLACVGLRDRAAYLLCPGTYWLVGWLMALMCHGDVGTRPACWTTPNTASDGQCVSCGLPHVYIRVKMGRSAHLMFTDAAGRCATID